MIVSSGGGATGCVLGIFRWLVRWLTPIAALAAGPSCMCAQQVVISTPLQTVNQRYARGGGMRLFAEQGSSRSFTSQTPTLVVPHGGTGAIFSGSVRPFVVGVVPVVGDGYVPISVWPQGLNWEPSPVVAGPGPSALQQRLAENWGAIASSAGAAPSGMAPQGSEIAGDAIDREVPESTAQRGDLSVAEILRRRAASSGRGSVEVQQLVQRGRIAEAEGKRAAARVFYQMAARRASAAERKEIAEQLRRLSHASVDDVGRD